jgi:hypothetical protein
MILGLQAMCYQAYIVKYLFFFFKGRVREGRSKMGEREGGKKEKERENNHTQPLI